MDTLYQKYGIVGNQELAIKLLNSMSEPTKQLDAKQLNQLAEQTAIILYFDEKMCSSTAPFKALYMRVDTGLLSSGHIKLYAQFMKRSLGWYGAIIGTPSSLFSMYKKHRDTDWRASKDYSIYHTSDESRMMAAKFSEEASSFKTLDQMTIEASTSQSAEDEDPDSKFEVFVHEQYGLDIYRKNGDTSFIRRGQVWMVKMQPLLKDKLSKAGKPNKVRDHTIKKDRPALIVSADQECNGVLTIQVIPLTRTFKDKNHVVFDLLGIESTAVVEQSMPKDVLADLLCYVTTVNDSVMNQIEDKIVAQLGLSKRYIARDKVKVMMSELSVPMTQEAASDSAVTVANRRWTAEEQEAYVRHYQDFGEVAAQATWGLPSVAYATSLFSKFNI